MRSEVYSFNNTHGELISELLKNAGADFAMPCSGRGVCGKCRVTVEGEVEEPSEKEKAVLSPSELDRGVRLACMTRVLGSVTVKPESASYADPFSAPSGSSNAESPYICAVDIGTTTIYAAVYGKSGTKLGSITRLNPQRAYGADVISRITRSLEGDCEALKAAVSDCIADMLRSLSASRCKKTVISGNTVMLYLLTGKSPSSLACAPFKADCLFGCEYSLGSINAYLPRCVAAYVGADITCSALEAGRLFGFGDDKISMLADIGTNGELVLSCAGKLLACSTAAGPAFEGASLYSGSVAREGAVESVVFNGVSFDCKVIGNTRGVSICGSGAVSVLCAMLSAGILDENGTFNEDGHRFTQYITEINGSTAFNLPGTDVYITREDVRNLQLAKAAMCAGMLTLIKKAGLKPDDVEQLIIAGGFGASLNTEHAQKIGLIPQGFASKTVYAPNAALEGAALLAINPGKDISFADKAEVVELADDADFFDLYISSMLF